MEQNKYIVTGMTCAACQAHVQKAVQSLPDVTDCTVNLLSGTMQVQGTATPEEICAAVNKAGYRAQPARPGAQAAPQQSAGARAAQEARAMRNRLLASLLFFVPLFYISMGSMLGAPLPPFLAGMGNSISYAMAQLVLVLPILYLNRSYFVNGYRSLWHRAPNMDSLIAVGATAALAYGVFAVCRMGQGLAAQDFALVHRYHMDLYFESAGTILTLITVGKYLETRSRGQTTGAVEKLMDLRPQSAVVLRDGAEQEVPLESVQAGEQVVLRPGARVPVDAVVLEGLSAVDQSAITGESMPVEKHKGDTLISASINGTGRLVARATRVGEDSTLAQIIRLVEDAGNSKAPIARLADKIAGVFVPIVMGIALAAALVWLLAGQGVEFALSTGIAVLVISCPCALGLATPVAIMVGTGKGAQFGILYKNAASLETAHAVDTVVLDKTGTITQGKPAVSQVLPAAGYTERQLLALAASLEQPSEHPLAQAVLARAQEAGLAPTAVNNFAATPGRGVFAQWEGSPCCAGNARYMREQGVDIRPLEAQAQALASAGHSLLYFARAGKLAGLIAAADPLKPSSSAAVAALHRMGLQVVMLTGDNARAAAAIEKRLGLDRAVAEVLPQDKEREVRALQEQGHKVAMVGDGINDAPALTRADLGIAIGAGTDIAMEAAGVVLMKSDLMDAVTAIELSRAVIRNVKENLFWAFFYNSVGIPLAAGVFYPLLGWLLNPMFAAAAMSLSSVFVVGNALRLRRFRPRATAQHGATPASMAQRPNPAAQSDALSPRTHVKVEETACSEQAQVKKGVPQMKKVIEVEGMMCAHCQAHVKEALSQVPGVTVLEVSLEDKKAVVSCGNNVLDSSLCEAVRSAGYTPGNVAHA